MLSDQSGRVVDQSWVDNVFSPKFLEQIEEYDGDFGTNPTDMSCVVRMDQTGEATRYYLSKGANANGVDEYTQTPLMMAFLRGFPATVRVLLQAGARVDAVHRSGRRACDFLGKPRHEASLLALGSETDFLECLQQVEEKGCDLINRPVGQEPLLVTASRFGYHKIAKYLLSLGADVNARSVQPENEEDVFGQVGQTPLHIAVELGDLKLVKLLLRAGADTTLREHSRLEQLPVEGCVRTGNVQVAHCIFKWEEEHHVQPKPSRGMAKKLSKFNMKSLREAVADYLQTGTLTEKAEEKLITYHSGDAQISMADYELASAETGIPIPTGKENFSYNNPDHMRLLGAALQHNLKGVMAGQQKDTKMRIANTKSQMSKKERSTVKQCGQCGAQRAELKECAGCHMVNYCHAAHQKAHWVAGHKYECKRLKQANKKNKKGKGKKKR